MDKIEKIRAEIERRKKENMYDELPMTIGRYYEDRDLLSFLDTLSEEPDKSLEEAADKHIRKVVDAAGHPGWDWTTQDISDAFIAGAKWQKEQVMKSPLVSVGYTASEELQRINYENGRKDMREQMLKDAVEAKIYGYDDGSFELIASWLDMPNNSIYKDGDKVRIIIVKEGKK